MQRWLLLLRRRYYSYSYFSKHRRTDVLEGQEVFGGSHSRDAVRARDL